MLFGCCLKAITFHRFRPPLFIESGLQQVDEVGGSGSEAVKKLQECQAQNQAATTRIAEISTLKVREHGCVKARYTALDLFTGMRYEDLYPLLNVVMTFANKAECQWPNVDADSGEVQSLMENFETKDDPKMPTSVKIGEPTEENEKRAADSLTAVDNGKGPHQGGQVYHMRLPTDRQMVKPMVNSGLSK